MPSKPLTRTAAFDRVDRFMKERFGAKWSGDVTGSNFTSYSDGVQVFVVETLRNAGKFFVYTFHEEQAL